VSFLCCELEGSLEADAARGGGARLIRESDEVVMRMCSRVAKVIGTGMGDCMISGSSRCLRWLTKRLR